MTTRLKLTIEYDGLAFCGWQRQAEVLSVQQTLEEAIFAFSGENVTLHVAGRTDTGVHALAQVAHFDLEKEMDERAVCGALNYHVKPHPISVLAAQKVDPAFHARFDAKSRRYRYLICNHFAPLALMVGRAWHFAKELDVPPMQDAAHLLLGKHDFSTFRASHCQANSPLRTLDELNIVRRGEMIVFETKARSFLYHQVRNMVGTLTLVGTGQWDLAQFEEAFRAADRTKGGVTAPPEGLYFLGVEY